MARNGEPGGGFFDPPRSQLSELSPKTIHFRSFVFTVIKFPSSDPPLKLPTVSVHGFKGACNNRGYENNTNTEDQWAEIKS